MLVFLSLFLSLNIFAQQDCQKYSVRCQCAPAVPFEGFQIYVVEVCDGQESWQKYFFTPQHDSDQECQEAIKKDKDCQLIKAI